MAAILGWRRWSVKEDVSLIRSELPGYAGAPQYQRKMGRPDLAVSRLAGYNWEYGSKLAGGCKMGVLRGQELSAGFEAAARFLEQHRDVINALNVYPVPDGDTGTNLLLTLRAALEKRPTDSGASAGQVTAGLAQGAFLGARGNSGGIFSAFLRGLAEALAGHDACDAPTLASAFRQASDAAYRAVGSPVEGTMLTVIRALAEGAQARLAQGELDPQSLWEHGYNAAREALARTPEQLALLREAGVVDAGGMGVVVILGGVLCHLGRLDSRQLELTVAAGYQGASGAGVAGAFVAASQEAQWGYCTQFLIQGTDLAPDELRRQLAGMDETSSAVVVGDHRQVRVHVHLADPGPALSLAVSLGQLSEIKIENMAQQSQQWAAGHGTGTGTEIPPAPLYERGGGTEQLHAATTKLAMIAVAPGAGLARLFRENGCAAVINGGPTMNPSVGQLLEAAKATGASEVILLPNDKNIIVAAQQAAGGAGPGMPRLRVALTRSVPQGVAAALAFNPARSLEDNLAAIQEALGRVVTVEVTRAIRDARIGGVRAAVGQYIGLEDGQLQVAAATAEEALLAALAQAGLSADKIVTLYWGEGATEAQALAARRTLESQTPGLQVDVAEGGQPHYPYLASVE
ncbi:MAG: DAK2 domain-containing protein [Dehalococcoidia bacterium]|nr:DAK2 domain-containing protein [Dehalococcoidia bacterium]